MAEISNRLGVHKRWNMKFLLKEIASRIPEQAGLPPERLAEYLSSDARHESKIGAYADGDPDIELIDVWLTMHWHAQMLMRRAEFDIYHGNVGRSNLILATWHEVLHLLLSFGRNIAGMGRLPLWSVSIKNVAEVLSLACAMGWNEAGDKIGEWALKLMPYGCLWRDSDFDPHWEKNREPFARFTFSLYADFVGIALPELPPHPYESPAYEALLACWRDPDAEVLVEPLLAACDWHTHECMYSRSDRRSKNVDFINDTLMGWPVEVHMVYRLRERLGLGLPGELDHPLMKSPLGAYLPPQPVPHDDRLDKIIRRACNEVPGLADVLAGAI